MIRTVALLTSVVGALSLSVFACSAGAGSGFNDDDDDGAGPSQGAGGEGFDPGQGGGDTEDGTICQTADNMDIDADGWTPGEGDCNDCDPNVNPGAIEVMTDVNDPNALLVDENCNMEVDEALPGACDDGLMLVEADAIAAARAIGMCDQATPGGKDFGVVYAHYVRADGAVTGISPSAGVLTAFGPNVGPRNGARMLGLSSGAARAVADPDNCDGNYSCSHGGPGVAPAGFPQDTPGCGGGGDINDDMGLEVRLRAPTNATGYSYDFSFYSFEYPEWVCTMFNDQYIALVDPPPAGSINGNISFDSLSNPVSINIAFFDVCDGCAAGTAQLAGTGFDVWDDAGATGWLQTTAPVEGGTEFNIRFAIWDTGDTSWDSTVLIDNFQWIADGGSVDIGTLPVPK